MWEMMTLLGGEVLNEEIQELHEDEYWRRTQRMTQPDAIREIPSTREPEYS